LRLSESSDSSESWDHKADPNSASLDDIRKDLLDSYEYIQSRLNIDIFEAGGSSMVDGSRCCALGWSAGGANVVYLVSRPPTLPLDGPLTKI
jgi:hypothetical protein